MSLLLVAVPVLPMLASLGVVITSRRFPGTGSVLIAVATALSLCALVVLHGEHIIVEARWLETATGALTIGLEQNGLTWFAAVLVAAIALPVTVYSAGYMHDDPDQPRFFAELGLFIGAMLSLVLASSLLLMFVAWEAIGVASYLLIGFDHRERAAGAAATQAFLMTRIGDMGFLLAWLLVLTHVGTTDIGSLLQAHAQGVLSSDFVTLIALLFFAAVVGKSAQLPLSIWLPDAMIAPTPVSALLHSATLVTAGVYLLLRLYPIFAGAPVALYGISAVGIFTAIVAALIATAAMDLKRILAWSTVSQLGEMVTGVGLGVPLAAALHLAAHASFKSTLFLAAGVVDKFAGTRDLRELGGLARVLPVTALCFVIGGLSLAGVQPFFTSSSHDALLAAALRWGPLPALCLLALLFLAGVYVGRAGIAVFAGTLRSPEANRATVHRSMQVGMIVLAVASASISIVVIVLPSVLPFGSAAEESWLVRAMALVVSLAGLALGGTFTWRHGAAPAFGASLKRLESGLVIIARMPPRIALGIGKSIGTIERWLDSFAQIIARSLPTLYNIERALDAIGRTMAHAVRRAALDTDRAERAGFDAGIDRLTGRLQIGGRTIRALQSGKLYLYTVGLFVWTLVVIVTGTWLFGR